MVLFYDLSTERLNEEAAVCFLYISVTVLFCYVESTPTLSLSLFMYEFSRKFSLVFTTACLYLCSIL